MGLRVRWQLAAKGAGVVLPGGVALQLVPALLKPPAPAPLPADVGLPRVVVPGQRVPIARRHAPTRRRKRDRSPGRLGRLVSGGGVLRPCGVCGGQRSIPPAGFHPPAPSRSHHQEGTPTPPQDPPPHPTAPTTPPPASEIPVPPSP